MSLKENYNTIPFDFFFLSWQFTERTVRKEALKCELSMKIFGNELSFLDCEDLRKQMKHYSLNLAELAVKLLKVKGTFFYLKLISWETAFWQICKRYKILLVVSLKLNPKRHQCIFGLNSIQYIRRSLVLLSNHSYLLLLSFKSIHTEMQILSLIRVGLVSDSCHGHRQALGCFLLYVLDQLR